METTTKTAQEFDTLVTPTHSTGTTSRTPFAGFFNAEQWFWFALLVLLGILLRWIGLDTRPVHHDESLHAMYGRYFFDWPDHNYYKYNPMLHGPFLYNFLRIVYGTLGSSTWAVRAPIALLGTLMIFLPLLFRRYFRPTTVLLLTAAVALSPTLVYWSRFIREDYPSLLAMLLLLIGVTISKTNHRPIFVGFGLSLLFCVKENSYVTIALLIGYFVYEFLYNHLVLKEKRSLVQSASTYIRSNYRSCLVGAAVCVFIFCYLFSAGFRHPEGILDGLYRESIRYWAEHHSMERIKGPFLFHSYLLGWYEMPFVIAFVVHSWIFYRRASWSYRGALLVTAVAALCAALIQANSTTNIEEVALWHFFKLKDLKDLVALFFLLVQPVIVTTYHLQHRQRSLAFWGYLFFASFFTYSYLGEKVPWLTVYPFTAGLVYFSLYFQDWAASVRKINWEKMATENAVRLFGITLFVLGIVFFAEEVLSAGIFNSASPRPLLQAAIKTNVLWVSLGAAIWALSLANIWTNIFSTYRAWIVLLVIVGGYNLRAAILTNFTYGGHAREFLSQVHTTPEFDLLVKKIRDQITNSTIGRKPTVLGIDDVVWPITWYLVDVPEYKFNAEKSERANFDYIFQNFSETPVDVPPGFSVVKVPLRGWWVPDYNQMTFKKYLNYTLNHTNWSDTGFTWVHLLVRQGAGK